MPKLTINGKEWKVRDDLTIMQACIEADIEVPHFCYHERLSIAGNCRMCLVEVKGSHKPVASCAMSVREGMEIITDSAMVKEARNGVMEFLLINHPLDCPICDQGGECDLQDQAMAYGRSYSRFQEEKRAVVDLSWGPLIKTHMTRCIHCMRCVRFATEVAGIEEIGSFGRGEETKIIPTIERTLSSELSGNIIDLCPVGALTSKPYAYKARPWELTPTHSIDVMDAMGSHIRIDARGREVMRILPRLCEDINEEWITDKARFSYDGLSVQRLDRPWLREGGKLKSVSWEQALTAVMERLENAEGQRMAALAGDLCCAESIFVLGDILDFYGCNHRDCRQDGALFDFNHGAGYLFGGGFASIDEADACLVVGSNLRVEAPLVHSRLLRRVKEIDMALAYVGEPYPDANLPYRYEGTGAAALEEMMSPRHSFTAALHKAQKPMMIIGMDAFRGEDGMAVHHLLHRLAEQGKFIKDQWWGFNVIQKAAARVGALSLGFTPRKKGFHTRNILKAAQTKKLDVLWLLGADDCLTPAMTMEGTFVIYIGHHGDMGAHHADVILPSAAYTEKNATYINNEGRVQQTQKAVVPPGMAREDWTILCEIARRLNIPLEYEDVLSLRKAMAKKNKIFLNDGVHDTPIWREFGKKKPCSSSHFERQEEDFYMTNSIARASQVMASCSLLKKKEKAA